MAAGLTACGDSASDTSEPTTSAQEVQISYHPCDQLPAEAMGALGLDLSTADRYERTNPVSLECTLAHRDPSYGVGIYALAQSYDAAIADSRLREKESFTVAGRDVSIAEFTDGELCMANIDIPPGVLQVSVDYKAQSTRPNEDLTTVDQACAEAKNIVNALGPHLPQRL
nr:DUF3558 family protein [Rhodococcus sp. HNM0569]